jgi:Ni/Fe-hydrogenase subunit HybB-like protein
LHQSSLGTVFLIMPNKLHPFWYTPLLPVFFFISAIAVGLAMTIFESSMSAKYFQKELELPILRELGRVLIVVLTVYSVLKFEDFYHRGMLKQLFVSSYERNLLLVELGLGLVIPLALLAVKAVRNSANGLYVAAVCTLLGFVANRLNVSITGIEGASGVRYVPKWTEIGVTGAFIAAGFALFAIAAKYLPIFDHEHHEEAAETDSAPLLVRSAAAAHGED